MTNDNESSGTANNAGVVVDPTFAISVCNDITLTRAQRAAKLGKTVAQYDRIRNGFGTAGLIKASSVRSRIESFPARCKLDARGSLYIPTFVREQLGINREVDIDIDNGTVVITPVTNNESPA